MVAPCVQDFIQVLHNVIMRMSGGFDYMIFICLSLMVWC